jgi:DNA-binding transcriptional ArsR family regulator
MINSHIEAIAARFKRTEPACARVIGTLQLLSNKTRFRIVCALSQAALSVTELVKVVGTSRQSNISLQLSLLSASGVISSRREGKSRIYALEDGRVRALIDFLEHNYVSKRGS